jgi:hypothetical protein
MSMKGPKVSSGAGGADAAEEGDEDAGDEAPEDEEEQGVRRDLTLSVVSVLGSMSDFKEEKCLLEQALAEQDGSGRCIWLPKYHAPCNAIEYVWGNAKKRNRKVCDYTMATLRTSAFRTTMTTERETVRKYFRKARAYQHALGAGADAFSMHKEVAKIKKERYTSHRRPAPSQYDAM